MLHLHQAISLCGHLYCGFQKVLQCLPKGFLWAGLVMVFFSHSAPFVPIAHCLSLGSPEADWETRTQVQVVDMEMMPESTGEVGGRIREERAKPVKWVTVVGNCTSVSFGGPLRTCVRSSLELGRLRHLSNGSCSLLIHCEAQGCSWGLSSYLPCCACTGLSNLLWG